MFGQIIEDEIARIKNEDNKLTRERLEELVIRGKEGDQDALEEVWKSLLLFISKHIAKSKYVGNLIEPDEVIGMSWETLLKVVQTWNGTSSFPHWFIKKLMMDLETEWRRRAKARNIQPRISDLWPDAPEDGFGMGWDEISWPEKPKNPAS